MTRDARVVQTPLGPGVTLYSALRPYFDPEVRLLLAVYELAVKDAQWLNEIESRPDDELTVHERKHLTTLTRGVVDPRVWLAEQ
jgi:hypothetical protein